MAKRDDIPEDIRREIEIVAIKAYEEEKAREKARIDTGRQEEARKAEIKSLKRCMFVADLFGVPYDKEYNEGRLRDLSRK